MLQAIFNDLYIHNLSTGHAIKAEVQMTSINQQLEDSPTGRLMEAIIKSMDEFCSDNLGEDVTGA